VLSTIELAALTALQRNEATMKVIVQDQNMSLEGVMALQQVVASGGECR
jgi:hypothetical protein